MDDRKRGLLYVLLGAIAFSLGGLFVKLIPWAPLSISGGRCIFSSMVIGLYIHFSGHRIKMNTRVLLGAAFVSAMLVCYVTSMKLTSAANAIVLEYTAPIFIILFEAILFRKKPQKLDLIVCIVVFAGIIIVVFDGSEHGSFLGDMVALTSGVFYALTIMLNDFKGSDSLSSVFFGHVFTIFIGLSSILAESDFSLRTLSLLATLGVFQAGAGYTLLTAGLKLCEPLAGSLVASIEPVLNPILVALFYGETMNVRAIIGAIIVIGTIAVYNVVSLKQDRKS